MAGPNAPYTSLDSEQVIKQVYDETTDRLRVDGTATIVVPPGGLQVAINHTEDSIRLGDGTDYITSTTIGSDVGLDVNIINPINVEVSAADGDSVIVSDGTNNLAINTDGSLSISIPGEVVSSYNEILAVANSILTSINTYTAPIGKISYLQKIEVSGTNIAEYSVEINSIVEDKKRTYFGNSLNSEFLYAINNNGLQLSVGDTVTVKVIHLRPDVGDFNARIQTLEI